MDKYNLEQRSEDQFTELVSYIREQVHEYNMPIIKETLIEDDLGVTGDEAEEFIISFSKKYKIDISQFNFTKYFYDEPGIFNLQNRIIAPLTVGQLQKAIIAGRLDEEVINN